MLASSMPPQTSLHYPRPLPSSTADDKDQSSPQEIMTSTISPASAQYPSAISPPNMACTLSTPSTTGNRHPTAPSRPKLTLQTSSLPLTFGTSSTGLSLSLAGGSTASPTVRNTFKNAYEVAVPPSATASPSKTTIHRISKPSSPYPSNHPYQQPLGVKSILRNSPLEPTSRRRSISVTTNNSNGLQSSRRVFFPVKKQVTYRQPLEEEIHTVRYTARHSDLTADAESQPPKNGSGEESDSASSRAPSGAGISDDDVELEGNNSSLTSFQRKKRKHLNIDKQVRAVALMDGLDGDVESPDTTPPTPCQDRSKRRCEWRWTLGPLDKRNDTDNPYPVLEPSTPRAEAVVVTCTRSEPERPSKAPASPTSLGSSDISPVHHSSSPSSLISVLSSKEDEPKTDTLHDTQCVHADQAQ